MQAINNPFTALIDGRKQFVIPVFQRDYSWTTEQCAQTWNDVNRAADSDGGGHFMGSIVYAPENTGASFSSWLVIDGQQRLTTLSLLLIALRDYIRENDWKGKEPTPEQIDAYFLKNILEVGERGYKLALRRHDNATLRALIDGGNLDDVEDRSELILYAYEYFKQRFKSDENRISEIYEGMGRIEIVDVKLEPNVDNPQLVFESLNSTGVDLTQSDLIRNYLLMGLTEPDQTRMYENYWSKIESLFLEAGSDPDAFLRDFMALRRHSTTQIRADRIYTRFKEFWQNNDLNTSLEEILEDMLQSARRYTRFLRPDRIESKELRAEMSQLRRLGVAHAILVMRLYECYDNGKLNDDELARALNLIGSFLVRRSVLKLNTRDYWSVFARIASSIQDEGSFESFQVALARQTYRFPADEDFLSTLKERNLYELRNCWHILTQLENAGQKEPSPTEEYSIEHIMPQSIGNDSEWQKMLGDDWEDVHKNLLHRLGNLTLTGYNSTYSNRSFEEKKTVRNGFEESAVRLNKYVREQSRWTAAEMKERGELLAARALEIWPYHGADPNLVINEEVRELRERSRQRGIEDLDIRDGVRNIFVAVRKLISDLGESIEVVEGNSLCYYDTSARFCAEVQPMPRHIRVLVPVDFDEVSDPNGVTEDVSKRKFLVGVIHHECGVQIRVWNETQSESAVAIVRQAFNMASE